MTGVQSEFERLFGTKTGPGRRAMTDEEKRRAELDRKRKAEAARRAIEVLKYRHQPEMQELLELEYRALADDTRFVLGPLDR